MSTVTSGSRLRGKESTGQCRDEGAAGPEGSRGHRGARGGAGLARASPSGHSPITKPQAQRPRGPRCPGSPLPAPAQRVWVAPKPRGPFALHPPHAGEHSLCPLPSRPPGNKVKLGGRELRTLRGRARGKPCPPPAPLRTTWDGDLGRRAGSIPRDSRPHRRGRCLPGGRQEAFQGGPRLQRAEGAVEAGSRGLSAPARSCPQERGWQEQLGALGLSGRWEPPGR